MSSVAAEVRNTRQSQQLTSGELADRCHTINPKQSPAAWRVTISRVESGRYAPRSDTLEVIARALGRIWVLR